MKGQKIQCTQRKDKMPRELMRLVDEPTLFVSVEFEIRDAWIGLYWRFEKGYWNLWIIAVPMLPLHIMWMDRRHRWWLEGLHECD